MEKMQDFKDSTPDIDDGKTLRTRLEEDGYLFVRGLLPAEKVMEVRHRLLRKASTGDWLDQSEPLHHGIANLRAACKDPEEAYMNVFRAIWRDEELHRLRTNGNVLSFFERTLGEPAFVHPMFVQRNIFPQHGDFDFTTGAHQDKVHIGGDTNYAMWAPIGDCPIEKGPLAVAVGSHSKGVLETRVGSGAGGMDISEEIPGIWATGEFNAGDVLIFQDTAVHKALPNKSREIRQSFDARYQPISQEIARPNLDPYSGTGNWEDVYSEWKSAKDQYYWEELNLNIVEFDKRYYEHRDEMAFAMAERGELLARDTLLRIIQRDTNREKIDRAKHLIDAIDRQGAA